MKERKQMDNTDITLVGHLTELRKRLLICIAVFILILPAAFYFSGAVCDRIFSTLANQGRSVYLFSITDGLVIRLSVALIISVVAELPLIVFETVRFVFPGLTDNEKKTVVCLSCAFSLCFLLGAAAFIFYFAPMIVSAWVRYDSSIPAMLSAKKFFDSWLLIMSISGLVFCTPILIFGIVRFRKNMSD